MRRPSGQQSPSNVSASCADEFSNRRSSNLRRLLWGKQSRQQTYIRIVLIIQPAREQRQGRNRAGARRLLSSFSQQLLELLLGFLIEQRNQLHIPPRQRVRDACQRRRPPHRLATSQNRGHTFSNGRILTHRRGHRQQTVPQVVVHVVTGREHRRQHVTYRLWPDRAQRGGSQIRIRRIRREQLTEHCCLPRILPVAQRIRRLNLHKNVIITCLPHHSRRQHRRIIQSPLRQPHRLPPHLPTRIPHCQDQGEIPFRHLALVSCALSSQ